ncbi:MAG TPA: S41 family peptidase [Steroidobacteraceae bacterium]|nr:S41 family peptidase [Steroidobacteraceae bacterium]
MAIRTHTLIALGAGVILGFSAALTTNVLAQRASDAAPAPRAGAAMPWEDAQLLAEVYERIKRDYVDEVDDHKLLDDAIRGMVSGLDSHSAFLDSEQFEEIRLSTMGSYPGVGIEVAADGSAVKILHPIQGSPAARAGIRAGDLIARIDGVAVGSDVVGAIEKLRGEAGTIVRLTVRRPSTGEVHEYTLKRTEVEVHSVEQVPLEPGFGYVRITGFSETTPQDLDRAIAQLNRQSPRGLKGLVLDLRNNPGGVLESGVAVADAFLDHGVIVTADGRTPDARFEMDATPGDVLNGAPLVVLVNSGTASAAEIVAGALKDHGRAELIGHRTYGKGTVQTVMPLSRGALKLTTSRYFTPSGASIHEKGILPDLAVEGREITPADLAGSTPLLDRDAEVRIALDALKAEVEHARTAPAALALVPVP